MLEGTDVNLIHEWQEYYDIEPFGAVRDDIRIAALGLKICSTLGGKREGGGKLKLDDFMLHFDKPQASKELTPQAAQPIFKERYGNRSKP